MILLCNKHLRTDSVDQPHDFNLFSFPKGSMDKVLVPFSKKFNLSNSQKYSVFTEVKVKIFQTVLKHRCGPLTFDIYCFGATHCHSSLVCCCADQRLVVISDAGSKGQGQCLFPLGIGLLPWLDAGCSRVAPGEERGIRWAGVRHRAGGRYHLPHLHLLPHWQRGWVWRVWNQWRDDNSYISSSAACFYLLLGLSFLYYH